MHSHELFYVLRRVSDDMAASYYRGLNVPSDETSLTTDVFRAVWFDSPHDAALGVMRYVKTPFVITPIIVYRGR